MLHRKGLARATLALACMAGLAFAPTALATPVEGPAGEAFYTPPSTLPEGGPGTLIWYRPTSVNLNVSIPSVNAWDVLYKSDEVLGNPVATTGTVIVPTAPWTGSGQRPVVTYAEGTQGLAHKCAPSLQLAAGTEYDGGAIVAALKKNYAVVVTDYQGYTNGATPSYTVGEAEAHAVLDIVRAAPQIPGSGISASAPVAIWGYSQGGQAAGWAGQIASSYAPGLHIDALAAGGVPANLEKVAEFGEGTPGSALGLYGVIGLAYGYGGLVNPQMELENTLNAEGLEAVAKLKSICVIEAIEQFHDKSFKQYSKTGESAKEVYEHNSLVAAVENDQKLGGTAPPMPIYHYHALEDEFVPIQQDLELHNEWCAKGATDDMQLYRGEHLLTDPVAVSHVINWIQERFEGKPATSTCGEHSASEVPPHARLTPETGDLIIPLPEWQISGTVTAAKLGIPLKIPAGATLSSEADVTSGTLTATLFVPPINETMTLFGIIPVNIQGSLEQAGPITGTFGLSGAGQVTLNATGGSTLTAKSIGIAFFRINLGCHTSSPIEMPLSISEPANALASGSLSFEDTVTIPSFTGCGPINSLLVTSLLSGPGNKISITASPPPPISW